jgi:carbohydrate-selective porin OprB
LTIRYFSLWINGEYAFNRTTAFFGRFGIGNYDGFNTAISQNLDLQPHTWAVGVSWRDLVLPGTLTGIAIGQPFVEADLGNATQTNFEAFYKLQLSDNLSVSPIVQLIDNANNDSANGITGKLH